MPEDLRWNAATLWAGPEVPHRPLPAVGLEGLQPRRHLSQRCARAGRRQAGAGRGGAAGFTHVCERAQNIIRHGKDWRMWVLCDRDPVDRWVDGRVALLGDAAHPMMQYMAQGACMAMEDAVCLANSLAKTDTLKSGLETYRDAARAAHHARAADVPRHGRSRLSPGRPARRAAQRHHERQEPGRVVRRPRLALWRQRAWTDRRGFPKTSRISRDLASGVGNPKKAASGFGFSAIFPKESPPPPRC